MDEKVTLWKRLYSWKVHHVLLWISYYVFWVSVYQNYYSSIYPLLLTTGFYLVFNALSFYTIAYYLVNRFLSSGKVAMFILLSAAVIIISSTGLSVSLYLMFHNIPEAIENFPFLVIGAFSSTMLTTSFLTAAKLIVERIRTDRIVKQVEKQRLESELQYLKAQVNPHFLFNAINSVYILIKKDPEKASETLIALSNLLRFQLYDCSEDSIAIERELENIDNYIGLEGIRKGNKVTVTIGKDGELSGFHVAPFLLMPFLENSFKYISNHADKPNEVRIGFRKTDREFVANFFNTCDGVLSNGVGGIGLKNVRRRLELLYPERHVLDIQQKEGSFQATLRLILS